jgi:hypothetical protein
VSLAQIDGSGHERLIDLRCTSHGPEQAMIGVVAGTGVTGNRRVSAEPVVAAGEENVLRSLVIVLALAAVAVGCATHGSRPAFPVRCGPHITFGPALHLVV